VIDTMVLIYLFEDHEEYAPACERLMHSIERGSLQAVVTPITMAELVVRPLHQGRTDIANAYRAALEGHPGISLEAIDGQVGWMAGALRAKYGLPLPDMIQVAMAMRAEKPALVTNDRALARVEEADICLLDELL